MYSLNHAGLSIFESNICSARDNTVDMLLQGPGFMIARECGLTHTMLYTGRIRMMLWSLSWIPMPLPGTHALIVFKLLSLTHVRTLT